MKEILSDVIKFLLKLKLPAILAVFVFGSLIAAFIPTNTASLFSFQNESWNKILLYLFIYSCVGLIFYLISWCAKRAKSMLASIQNNEDYKHQNLRDLRSYIDRFDDNTFSLIEHLLENQNTPTKLFLDNYSYSYLTTDLFVVEQIKPKSIKKKTQDNLKPIQTFYTGGNVKVYLKPDIYDDIIEVKKQFGAITIRPRISYPRKWDDIKISKKNGKK